MHGQHGLQVFDDNIFSNNAFTLIETLVSKAMLDNQGSNKGNFTKDDWLFACQMWPNLHWTIDEAEQTLYALIEEGRIQEIEVHGQLSLNRKKNKKKSYQVNKYRVAHSKGEAIAPMKWETLKKENPELYKLLYAPIG